MSALQNTQEVFTESKYLEMHSKELDELDRSKYSFMPNKGFLFNKVKKMIYNSINETVCLICKDLEKSDYAGIIQQDSDEIINYLKGEISKM